MTIEFVKKEELTLTDNLIKQTDVEDSDMEDSDMEDSDMEDSDVDESGLDSLDTEKKNITNQENVLISDFDDEEDSDYSTDSSDDDDDLKKLEKDDTNILLDYHPETKQINYKEVLTYATVKRNKLGQIIDDLHKTVPFLTKFERARILGLRSKQINNGSSLFLKVPDNIMNSYTIAEMELKAKKIPFIIKRPLPNGGSEYWKLQDLELIE